MEPHRYLRVLLFILKVFRQGDVGIREVVSLTLRRHSSSSLAVEVVRYVVVSTEVGRSLVVDNSLDRSVDRPLSRTDSVVSEFNVLLLSLVILDKVKHNHSLALR